MWGPIAHLPAMTILKEQHSLRDDTESPVNTVQGGTTFTKATIFTRELCPRDKPKGDAPHCDNIPCCLAPASKRAPGIFIYCNGRSS